MLLLYIVFLIMIAALRKSTNFQPKISTSDGAIIMASGIVTIGALHQFLIVAKVITPYFVIFMLALLSWFVIEYMKDGYERSFYDRHLSDPVKSFAAGTWIAAISVVINVISIEMPTLKPLAGLLFYGNLLLLVFFLALVIRNYYHIFSSPALLKKIRGILLHGCVALQSVAVAGNSLYGSSFPELASFVLIFAGLFFYVLGLFFVCIRYKKSGAAAGWDVTNTIIYGGLSITGLALSISSLQMPDLIAGIWLTALLLLIVVETFDIRHGFSRIKNFGLARGLFAYQPAQWARNFTLGMFLTFTITLDFSGSFLSSVPWITGLQQTIINSGRFVVIGLFLIEAFLACRTLYEGQEIKQSVSEIKL